MAKTVGHKKIVNDMYECAVMLIKDFANSTPDS